MSILLEDLRKDQATSIQTLDTLIQSSEFKNSAFAEFIMHVHNRWRTESNGKYDRSPGGTAFLLLEDAANEDPINAKQTPIIKMLARYIEDSASHPAVSSALHTTAGGVSRRDFLCGGIAALVTTAVSSIAGTKAIEHRTKRDDERRLATAALNGPKTADGTTPTENISTFIQHHETSLAHHSTFSQYAAGAATSGAYAIVAAMRAAHVDNQNRNATANTPKTLRTMLEEVNKLLEAAIAAQRNAGTAPTR